MFAVLAFGLLTFSVIGVTATIMNRPSEYEDAISACSVAPDALADQGSSIHLTGSTLEDATCLLNHLDFPTSVVAKIERTASVDGVQRETVDGVEVSWKYHPNTGLDLIFADRS